MLEGMALPLGKGMDDLSRGFVLLPDAECDGTLHPVQVVVETGFRPDKQGRRYTGQMQ